uniref:Transcription factor BYE1 n=1 Tax=Blastobotrys adeninivorans TaxID=409370 RepID=A0A060T2S0_BLAAD
MEGIRRSSRSTKGKNTRLEREWDLEAEQATQKQRKKRRDNSVNCPCGTDDESLGTMIECENCGKWQHLKCMFGKDDESLVPEVYYCHECKDKVGPVQGNVEDKVKSKDESNIDKQSSKDATVSEDASTKSQNNERSISQFHDKVRSSVAVALHKILNAGFSEAIQKKRVDITEEEVPSASEKLALDIEQALYDQLAVKPAKPSKAVDVGHKYRDKFRSISFNLKDTKNVSLRMRVISGELGPHELVTMTNEDMSNPELQKLAEEVRRESIRDSVLKVEEVPRLRKTHKGEELIDPDERFDDPTFEHDMQRPPSSEAGEAHAGDKESNSGDRKQGPGQQDYPEYNEESQIRDSHNNMYESNSSLNLVSYSPTASDDEEGEGPNIELEDDEDLDEIINDKSNGTDEKKEEKGGDAPIWSGEIKFTGFVAFSGTATPLHSPSGFDWDSILSSDAIEIDGRLDKKKAEAYLHTVKATKDIVSLILTGDDDGCGQVFDYFHPRGKYGVIVKHKHARNLIKDAYAVTLGPDDPVPSYLELSRDEIDKVRTNGGKTVLGVFVVNRSHTPQLVQQATFSQVPPVSQPPQMPVAAAEQQPVGPLAGLNLSPADLSTLERILQAHPHAAQDPQLLIQLLQSGNWN